MAARICEASEYSESSSDGGAAEDDAIAASGAGRLLSNLAIAPTCSSLGKGSEEVAVMAPVGAVTEGVEGLLSKLAIMLTRSSLGKGSEGVDSTAPPNTGSEVADDGESDCSV